MKETAQNVDKKLASLIQKAQSSERGRAALALRKPEDPVQEIINAIEPRSYMQPHKHSEKRETRTALTGKIAVVIFNDNGKITETRILGEDGGLLTTEVEAGVWHMLVSLQEGSAIQAVIDGPYEEGTHKELAPWAPSEKDSEQGQAYLKRIKAKVYQNTPPKCIK